MISKLKKINIIAPKQYQEEILDILQYMGIAHIISSKFKVKSSKLTSAIETIDYQLSNIKFALRFLDENIKIKQSLKEKLSFEKKPLTYRQIQKRVKKLNIDKITSRITDIEKNLEQGQAKLQQIETQLLELAPWKNLKEQPDQTKYTVTITGTISLNKYSEFIRQLEAQVKEIAIETIYQGLKEVYLQISFLKEKQNAVDKLKDEYRFQIQKPEVEGSPAEKTTSLEQDRIRLKNTLKKWRRYIKKFKKYYEPLKMAEDFLTWEREKLETQKHTIKTKFFISIKAWVKRDDVKPLKNAAREISPNILIKPLKVKTNETPPVIIENNKFIKPFETVTGIYGMPQYSEIDPTPYLAPFFIIFFALCLTDAGYGLVMAIVMFGAIKLLKIPQHKQRLFRLLGYGGIVTFVVGALFGGWFGIDVAQLSPGPVKHFIEFFKLIDPMKDTVLFMGIAFALGIIQIWFSQIVKTIAGRKNKNKGETASGIAWAVFLISAMIILTGKFLHLTNLTNLGLYIILLSTLSLIIIESRNTKNIFVKPLVGIVVIIQGLIGFVSDTLSYSRLMALGLATGIIAFIINTIAVIFRDLIPYFGWIVWVMILIGGHLFNLGINALGGFIHSGRLQFVEFFPKFMEGGGERFVPFKRESKYFNLSGS